MNSPRAPSAMRARGKGCIASSHRWIAASVPACRSKAAYRFFGSQRVSEAQTPSGHFAATRERVCASDSPVLVLQDTTDWQKGKVCSPPILFSNESMGGSSIQSVRRFRVPAFSTCSCGT